MSSPEPIQSPVEALEMARRESQQAAYKQLHATLQELHRLDVPVLDDSHLQALGIRRLPDIDVDEHAPRYKWADSMAGEYGDGILGKTKWQYLRSLSEDDDMYTEETVSHSFFRDDELLGAYCSTGFYDLWSRNRREPELSKPHLGAVVCDSSRSTLDTLASEVEAAITVLKFRFRRGDFTNFHTIPVIVYSFHHDESARITQAYWDGNGLVIRHSRLLDLRGDQPTSDAWKAGDEEPKGSALQLEHFLHLRALVQQHGPGDFPLHDLVKAKYVEAAESFMRSWQDFDNYIIQVPTNDPAIDVDNLGVFAGAKLVQNQVLLDAYLETAQEAADSFQDSTLETPLKKRKKDMMNQDIDFHMKPPEHDAADEQVVNQALISFASALTRRWMVQQAPTTAYANEQTPTKGGDTAVPPRDWKTIADWTMTRDRFHIRERVRNDDLIQKGHMEGLMASTRKDNIEVLADNHSYVRVLTSETDGSLYHIEEDATEVLAIVEAKKRLRRRNRLKIEWQEAAEILAWLNVRLRAESAGKGKGLMTERRGMLEPKPAAGKSREKSRCLLVAQDREEMHLVIGEWDDLYEEYALEGKFSDANIKALERLKATRDPARADAGFLALHVYGPFGGYTTGLSSRDRSMRKLSANLLALSLHLSQASCSPSSRRVSPAASIQLPAQRRLSRKVQSLAEENERTAVVGLDKENPAPNAQNLVLAKTQRDKTRRPRGTSAPVRRDLTMDARPQSGTSQFLDLSKPMLMIACQCEDAELPPIRRAARAKPVPNLVDQSRAAEMLLRRDITASRQQLQRQFRGLLPCHKPPEHLYWFRVSSNNTKANDLLADKQLRRQPDETPVKKKKDKKNTPIKGIFSFGKKKDKGDKK
ncbi:hypothetical protein SLS64_009859 [Diaporthe eres]